MTSTEFDSAFLVWVTVWLVVALIVVWRHARGGSGVGLMLSYVVSLGVLHWFAPMLYLLPTAVQLDPELTLEGLRQSVLAIAGLGIGAEIARSMGRRASSDVVDAAERAVPTRLVNLYLLSGALMYVLLFTVAGRFPTLRALIVTGSTLMVVGVALKCWNAWVANRHTEAFLWLTASAVFPVVTVLTQGYLGYGFAAMLTVFGFFASLSRPTWKQFAVAMVLAYCGLSVYVTYMRDRQEIRETVWYGGSTTARLERLTATLDRFEWFNSSNYDHMLRVEDRLNQDFLVGAAVVHLRGGAVPFAQGATIWDAAIALIPRALWPNKPIVGGSGDLVSIYTGIRFGKDTSVGIGHVLEWYVNFGGVGVVLGFTAIGALLIVVDRSARAHLRAGNASGFLLWYLPALSLLQIGGSLAEAAATAGASYCVGVLFVLIMRVFGASTPVVPAQSPAEANS